MSSKKKIGSSRRNFLKTMCLAEACFLIGSASVDLRADAPDGPIGSAPVLQCPTETGVDVVWSVNRFATGYIELGVDKDKLDRQDFGERCGLRPFDDRVLHIRLEGLEPGTRYYYRTVTIPTEFLSVIKYAKSEPVSDMIRSFVTPGPDRKTATFSVINDTHDRKHALERVMPKLAEIGSDFTIWNGDVVDDFTSEDQTVAAVLNPLGFPYAAEHPVLFLPGNHDHRGKWVRDLSKALPMWSTRSPSGMFLGRNFALRSGPLALIGLDTGEDKPDDHREYGGLVGFTPYRIAQREWLEQVMRRPDIASAPYVVAFCHIPLERTPTTGQIRPGTEFRYIAGDLWGPVLDRFGVQLLISAHYHRFRYDKPSDGKSWAQIIGGGFDPKGQVTVIHARADERQLEVAVDELNTGKELGRWKFPKRT